MDRLIDALLGVAATTLLAALGVIIRTLFAMRRDVRGFAGPIRALVEAQPYIIKATRHQNAALKEIGANGSTTESNNCLDEADRIFDRLLVESVPRETK